MLQNGPAIRVIIHLNEDTGSHKDYLHREVVSFLFANEVSGATVIRPHGGFGFHHRVHTAGAAGIEGQHLPIRIEFVETRQKVDSLLPQLFELVTDGIIEAQETTVLKVAGQSGSSSTGGPQG
jgi:uncharacterized protein